MAVIRNTVTLNNGETWQQMSKTVHYTHCVVGLIKVPSGVMEERVVSWHKSDRLARNAAASSSVSGAFYYASVYPVTSTEYNTAGGPA